MGAALKVVPDGAPTVRGTIDTSRIRNSFQQSLCNELQTLAGLQTTRAQSRRARDIMQQLTRYGILVPIDSIPVSRVERFKRAARAPFVRHPKLIVTLVAGLLIGGLFL